MKALTLRQPWATLVAIGAKKIETRSWKTKHRGLLAIHAGATFSKAAIELCDFDPFLTALAAYTNELGSVCPDKLPTGAVIAICELADCTLMTSPEEMPPEPERSFGTYVAGWYAWHLMAVHQIAPRSIKGRLGLWEWNGLQEWRER